jgi:hypothetical protein
MRRARGRYFNRVMIARAAGVLAVVAAIAIAAVYLAAHQAPAPTVRLPLSSSSSISLEDET